VSEERSEVIRGGAFVHTYGSNVPLDLFILQNVSESVRRTRSTFA